MALFKWKFTRLVDLLKGDPLANVEQIHTVKGWVRSRREQSKLSFIEIYDGSCIDTLQLVVNLDDHDVADKKIGVHVSTFIEAVGKIIKSPAKGQLIEMQVQDIKIIGKVTNLDSYPPSIKGLSLANIRDNLHLAAKFKAKQAIYAIRSKLTKAVHDYMHQLHVHHLDPNIVTTADCEGAGEMFTITTLFDTKDGKIPTTPDGKVDFSKDFFRKQSFLTVSSQLQLEALCAGMGAVYTMNPSFRAEPSKTKRHLGCFTHLEWELMGIDLDDLMNFSEDLVTHCIKYVLKECNSEVLQLDSFVSKGLKAKLESFVADRFARIPYDEAIDIIATEADNIKKRFPELIEIPKWGDDLGSYCERYLSEVIYQKPMFVYNYPRELKSFYMKQNPEYEVTLSDGSKVIRNTVQGCDLLIPGLGELIGSSIREEDLTKLETEMHRRKMNFGPLKWYLDLRANGTYEHGGAGMGFDRLVNVCTLMEGDVRDVVPFPVAYGECEY